MPVAAGADVESGLPDAPLKVLRGPWDPPSSVVALVSASDRGTEFLDRYTATARTWAGWKIRLGYYYAIDQMARIDAFPFNRLPEVTPEMRLEPGHEHTYRTLSATSGLTRHVCTSCGLVMVKSGRSGRS